MQYHSRVVLVTAAIVLAGGLPPNLLAQEAYSLPRCETIPLPGHRTALTIDGRAQTMWHFATDAPRPFFFPLRSPAGGHLTRMGHPGAENHDHHRSVWFAHEKVDGVNFWSDKTDGRIRQHFWYAYQDGPEETVMAVQLGWYDGKGTQLLQQDVVAALIPMPHDEYGLEIQIDVRPPAERPETVLGKTNFGFLAVRVAKSLSVHFGGGILTNSEGQVGEQNIFGKPARWMDYSGPIASGAGETRKVRDEGITYFDHPQNPRYPTSWHVRSDGWMGASCCMHEGLTLTKDTPLRLRYLLHSHRDRIDANRAEAVAAAFAARSGFSIAKSTRPHRQYEAVREDAAAPTKSR